MRAVSIRSSRIAIMAYLIGLFDGEGCLTINVEKDKRKGAISEVGAWRIIPCVQFTNSDNALVLAIDRMLKTLGQHPTIQRYPNGSAHVRLWRASEIEAFCREAMMFSNGAKSAQLSIFINKLIPIFESRPLMGKRGGRIWTTTLFLQAMTLIDEINQFKRSRRTARRYSRAYFAALWNLQ